MTQRAQELYDASLELTKKIPKVREKTGVTPMPYNIQQDFIDPANQGTEMNNKPDDYYDKLSSAYLENLKKEVYNLHLPTTQEYEQVIDLIEKAFALGGLVGYDGAKSKLSNILIKFGEVQ